MDRRERWEYLHCGAYRRELSPDLAKGWEASYALGVDPLQTTPLRAKVDLKEEKAKLINVYAYTNRFLEVVRPSFSKTKRLGFALFNAEGVLLKGYGEEDFFAWAKGRGFGRLTDWSLEAMGTGAVSMALRIRQPAKVVGEEHFCWMLNDLAAYAAPILPMGVGPEGQAPRPIAALGVFMPVEEQDDDYLGVVKTMAYDIQYNIYIFTLLNALYAREETGFISLDKSEKTGVWSVLYNNRSACEALNIQPRDLSYEPITSVIDPLPANQEFWELLESKKPAAERSLAITVGGTQRNCIVSVENFCHASLRANGYMVHINTAEQIAAQISRKTGNNARFTFEDIVGPSLKMKQLKEAAEFFARSDSNVLIVGESGTGKDVFAQAIHNASARKNKPFISINCAALPRELIASELFGYESGAFTGAKRSGNIGKFELANEGTIFLDEIGDMPLDIQATLLHVLEKQSFNRLGGNQRVDVNVKVIAATNADLMELVRQKRFRLDLFYRLCVLTVRIPPLRDRREDIVPLANHFLQSLSVRAHLPNRIVLSDRAAEYLTQLPWQGNVRELQNTIEGVVQTQQAHVIEPRHIRNYREISGIFTDAFQEPAVEEQQQPQIVCKKYARDGAISREALQEALALNKYKKEATAQYLGVSRKTLYRWLKEKGL